MLKCAFLSLALGIAWPCPLAVADVIVTESAGSTQVAETGPTSDTYTIVLDLRPSSVVRITVQPDVQTDVGAGPGSPTLLSFPPGNWYIPLTVTVTAVDDAIPEGPHTSTITHTAESGDPNYAGISISSVIAEVADNDTPGITIAETDGTTAVAEQGPTSDTYTVVLDSQPTATVIVTVTPDSQTDVGVGAGVPTTLTFTTGDWKDAQIVTVTAVDDALPEGPHTSTITHTAESDDSDYHGISISSVVADVADNDTPGVTIAETDGTTTVAEQGPTSDTYTLVLDSQPTATVIVTVTPDSQTDVGVGAGVPTTLTFTTGDWNDPQTVTVTAVDDALAEGSHTSSITHTAESDDPDYHAISISSVVADVADNDTPGVTIAETDGTTTVTEQGPTSDTYTVVLDSQPTATVIVTVAPDSQTDVGASAAAPITLTFTAGDWNALQTIVVTAVDDSVPEGPHTSTITHTSESDDPDYDALLATLLVSISDNDSAPDDDDGADDEGDEGDESAGTDGYDESGGDGSPGAAGNDSDPANPDQGSADAGEDTEVSDSDAAEAESEDVDADIRLQIALSLFFGVPICGQGYLIAVPFAFAGCVGLRRSTRRRAFRRPTGLAHSNQRARIARRTNAGDTTNAFAADSQDRG